MLKSGGDGQYEAAFSEFASRPEFLRSLVAHMCDGLSVADLQGRRVLVNQALCQMTGYTAQELMEAGPPYPYWPPEELDTIRTAFARVQAGDMTPCELVFARKDGERFPVWLRPASIMDELGQTVAFFTTISDITQQKRAQVALTASEQRWRSLVENPFDFVVVIDRDYKFRFINHTAPTLRMEDLIGKATPFEFTAPEHHAEMRRAFEFSFATGRATSYQTYSPQLDGWFTTIVGPIHCGGEIAELSLLTRDTTDAKRAEQAQRRSERRLELALEGSDDGLVDWNLLTGVHFYSPRTYALLGFADGDTALSIGEKGMEERIHPDDRTQVLASLQRAITDGDAFSEEYRLRTKSDAYRWFHERGRTFRETETEVRFISFLTDITQRREAEEHRRSIAHELQQAQRLETIGTLAGGIAHDFNNLLTPILGGIELALMALERTHPAHSDLSHAVAAALRAQQLTQQILTFARHGEARHEPVDVVEVAREGLRFLSAGLPSTVEIETRFQSGAQVVLGDRTQLHQIVANLLTNAQQAMQGAPGRLQLLVDRVELAAAELRESPEVTPGSYVRITVRDAGVGMPQSVKNRAFEPFFTTKPVGQGTGLGLSVVHGVVTRHRGHIRVQSEVGKGTTFEILLPASDVPPAQPIAKPITTAKQPRGAGKRVLCVDDEPSVLCTVKRTLEAAGYHVTGAACALEALELMRAAEVAFDLVLTDYSMPELSGLELAQRLRSLAPKLPIVLLTGFAEGLERASELGVAAVVSKPFRLSDLVDCVHECLTAPSPSVALD